MVYTFSARLNVVSTKCTLSDNTSALQYRGRCSTVQVRAITTIVRLPHSVAVPHICLVASKKPRKGKHRRSKKKERKQWSKVSVCKEPTQSECTLWLPARYVQWSRVFNDHTVDFWMFLLTGFIFQNIRGSFCFFTFKVVFDLHPFFILKLLGEWFASAWESHCLC